MDTGIVNRSTNIIINTSFSATHCWPNCPIPEVKYLKNPHRHVFHLRLKFPVSHADRDIEFINMKNQVHAYIETGWEGCNLEEMSCETIAKTFLSYFKASYVRVMEDDENGAEVYKEV